MQPLPKDSPSYFDYAPQRDASSEADSEPISPGTSRNVTPRPRPRRGYVRSKSDYGAIHKRIRVQAVPEDRASHSVPIPGEHTSNTSAGLDRRGKRHVVVEPSLYESTESTPVQSDGVIPGTALNARQESSSRSPGRPAAGRKWLRSTSGSVWFRVNRSSAELEGRPSSSPSTLGQSGSEILLVRTDQTPLSPPGAPKNNATIVHPPASSIRVETDSVISNPRSYRPEKQSTKRHAAAAPRKNSFNPLQLFSAPLLLMRRASLSKRQNKSRIVETQLTPPEIEDPLLEDHRTLLKRNHTAEALSRVSAILQEMIQPHQSSARPSGVIKSLKWRTFSDRWTAMRADKDHLTVPGSTDLFTPHQRKSMEQLSDTRSYTSSVRNLLIGQQPNNSPAEQATYRVKRSASAETEEFLKVDISIRGGTSYLPSEARRIHTPPLPEEGADGKWRGFFFDYNAPRQGTDLSDYYGGKEGPDSGNNSPESAVSESQSASNPLFKKGGHGKGRKPRKIVGGDWYDVQLAELGLGDASDRIQTVNAKEGERRVNLDTWEVLSRGRRGRRESLFDLRIPEHLPSSPLCPRNPRYWRVVKGQGDQFRGCWMHGVGVYNDGKGKQDGEGDVHGVEEQDKER